MCLYSAKGSCCPHNLFLVGCLTPSRYEEDTVFKSFEIKTWSYISSYRLDTGFFYFYFMLDKGPHFFSRGQTCCRSVLYLHSFTLKPQCNDQDVLNAKPINRNVPKSHCLDGSTASFWALCWSQTGWNTFAFILKGHNYVFQSLFGSWPIRPQDTFLLHFSSRYISSD